MSENPWPHRPEPPPDVGSDQPYEPARVTALDVEHAIVRQEAEMTTTMAEWLARMHALDWGTVDSEAMTADVREWRDREAG